MLALRGRISSRLVPTMVPTIMSGTMRTTSALTAWRGFSEATRSALEKSCNTNTASANGSGTKWVASGMVTSAEPNPVMP